MKISVVGNAAVLTSSIKVEEIKTLQAGNPQALKVFKDKENTDEVFGISYCEDATPSVGKYGITFNSATRDENKYATLTLTLPRNLKTNDEIKAYIADKAFGTVASSYMAELEKSVPTEAKKLTDARTALIGQITVS